MTKEPGEVAVITADIVGSSRYSSEDRQRVDEILRHGFQETRAAYRGVLRGRLNFRVTAGDEFQWVIGEPSKALETLTHLRAVVATADLKLGVRFRASIGVGEISVAGYENTYEQDGSAFVRARRGLEELATRRGVTRSTKLTTGKEHIDAVADAILGLADFLFQRWSSSQWEAVRWSVQGETREAIASKLKISHQGVTKRLITSGWPHLEPALGVVSGMLL